MISSNQSLKPGYERWFCYYKTDECIERFPAFYHPFITTTRFVWYPTIYMYILIIGLVYHLEQIRVWFLD